MAFANQFAAHQLTIKHLAGKQYRTDAEFISAVEDFFRDQDESLYTTGIQALQHRRKKCVDCRGDSLKITTCIKDQYVYL